MQQHFRNASALRKITETNGVPYYDGAPLSISIATIPGLDYQVNGSSSDGGTTPDATTQSYIDALVASGVPLANIVWRYVIVGVTITMPTQSRVATITVSTLTGVMVGALTMPTQSNTPTITIPTLTGIAGGYGTIIMPTQSISPSMSIPTLEGVMTGLITVSTINITQVITVSTLVGVNSANGTITMMNVDTAPVITVSTLTGVMTGILTMPTQSRVPTITVSSIVGVMTGSLTMPYTTGTPSISVPTLTGVADGPVAVSDNFNRANGTLNVSPWVKVYDTTPALQIYSNFVAGESGAAPVGSYYDANFAANQYSESQYVSGSIIITAVRMATGARTCYYATLGHQNDGDDFTTAELFKVVNGTPTSLGTWESGYGTLENILRLEASGTTITLKTGATHGGTMTSRVSVTDSAIASGKAGLYGAVSNASGAENWYGGDL